MEDYEKKYKEALERAKKELQTCGSTDCDAARQIIRLFPELKESEDEKIRKELIAWLKNSEGQTLPIDRYHAALAWLEKQGSSSVKWQKNTPDNKPAINHTVLMKTTIGIVEGEWHGEHWFQYRWSCRLKDSEVLYWIELHELDKQGEQKPFDYEHATITQKDFASVNYTDEEVVDAVKNTSVLDMVDLAGLDNDKSGTLTVTGGKDYKISVKPSKEQDTSIKVESHPKYEWSEEDEKMTKELIEGFLSSVSPYQLTHTCKEIADWLKSIKDRM